MKFETVFFDLDGTLTDPGLGITNAVWYALDKLGFSVSGREELYKFIGPPLSGSFMKYYGMTQDEAENAISIFREYFRDKGIFENELFDGILELLSELSKNRIRVVLATSKPKEFARRILDHFNISQYFDYVCGSEFDGTREKKEEVIEYIIEKLGITDLSKCIMVGDRKYDILGGKKNRLTTCGVLFGYGSREELEDAGADFICESVSELRSLLVNL